MTHLQTDVLPEQSINTSPEWLNKETPQSQLSEKQKTALLGAIPDEKFLKAETGKTQKMVTPAPGKAVNGQTENLPEGTDWRLVKSGYITPVSDQGNCGSGVSFATVSLLESMALIEKGWQLELSAADCHFNAAHGVNCTGWWPNKALEEMKTRGVCSETAFPYYSAFPENNPFATSKDGGYCKVSLPADTSSNRCRVSISNWTSLASVAERKKYLAQQGPMLACFDVYDDFFSYGSGVYVPRTDKKLGMHCVLVIGYSEKEQCWICKNSWGSDWGEGGFFKIKYGACGIDNDGTQGRGVNPFYGANGILRSNNGLQPFEMQSSSKLAVGRNQDGRLEVFCIDGQGWVWHAWQTAPNNGWSNWTTLNTQVRFIGNPVVASNADGRLEVFCVNQHNKIMHIWQTSPNGGWSQWYMLGVYDGQFSGTPAVILNSDGRLEVFAVGIAQKLYHIKQVAPNSYWNNWSMLGNAFFPMPRVVGSPAVGRNQDGTLEVFYKIYTGNILRIKQNTPGSFHNTLFSFLGSYMNQFATNPYNDNNPVVATNRDGRLQLFCVDRNGNLFHFCQTTANGAWGGWNQIYMPSLYLPLTGSLAVGNHRDGRIEVVVSAAYGYLIHSSQHIVNEQTTIWQNYWQQFDRTARYPAMGANEDGRLEVFAVGNYPNHGLNTILHTWQVTPNGNFN